MPSPITCLVSGTLFDAGSNAVSGAKVRALVMSSFTDAYGNVIAEGLYANTTTDANGAWSLAVIQTASLNQAITFQFIYPLNNNQTYYVSYPAVIPNTSTANFADIVDLSSSTATVTAAATSDNVVEGTVHLFAKDARTRAAISATSPINYDSSTGVISTSLTNITSTDALPEGSTNLYFTNARADARITAQKGAANGLAPLASDSKIDISYLPAAVIGGVQYQGSWNANTNSPTLVTSTGTKGYYYVVSVPGSTNLDGITDWKLGDWAIFNGSVWQKVDNTDAVTSVNGAIGAVVLSTSDIPEGSNLYSTTARIRAALSATSPVTYNSSTGVIAVTGLSGTNTGDQTITLTGDVTGSGTGSFAATLATVNGNVGSFGSTTAIPNITVNAKGLVTAVSTSAVVAPAGTLSGSTLATGVTASSLTSVGTIATGVWNGTTIALANGGTGQTTKAAAFDALQPMTTSGDIIYGGTSGTGTRLAKGTDGQVLKLVSGLPAWSSSSSYTAPQSQLYYEGHSGRGSTNTAVVIFATQRYSLGSDITYATSATLGDSFTINTAGVYTVTYSTVRTAGGTQMGLSVNGSVLNTDPLTPITYAQGARGIAATAGAGIMGLITYTNNFSVNDVVRALISTSDGSIPNDNRVFINITRIT